MNSTEARTETGEIKNQASTQPVTTPQVEEKTEPKVEVPAGPPEKYEFKLPDGVPEGTKLDEKLIEGATPIFKELNLTNDQAQKLVDFYNKTSAESAKALSDTLMQQVTDMRKSWVAEVKADKDIGPKLAEVETNIGKLKNLLPEAIRTAFNADMDFTGAGDRIGFVKAFNYLAEMLVEGKHVTGGNPSPHGQNSKGLAAKPSIASAMYPNLPN